ncbi:MAG: cation:proton antiporter subunit C [Pirellulaceae bacterium]
MIEHITSGLQRPNFVAFVILFLWGLFIMVSHPNLMKKLIGMYLVQTSIIFLLVTFSAKKDATVPILRESDTVSSVTHEIDPADYANPLPHVLTLTAIVVQVATLGVSLALVTAIYRTYGSLDENEILERLE